MLKDFVFISGGLPFYAGLSLRAGRAMRGIAGLKFHESYTWSKSWDVANFLFRGRGGAGYLNFCRTQYYYIAQI